MWLLENFNYICGSWYSSPGQPWTRPEQTLSLWESLPQSSRLSIGASHLLMTPSYIAYGINWHDLFMRLSPSWSQTTSFSRAGAMFYISRECTVPGTINTVEITEWMASHSKFIISQVFLSLMSCTTTFSYSVWGLPRGLGFYISGPLCAVGGGGSVQGSPLGKRSISS